MNYLDNPGNRVVRQTVRLQQLNMPGMFLTHQGIENAAMVEAVARLEGVRNLARFIMAAEEAKAEQLSYRNFAVGAAALAAYFSEMRRGWTFWLLTGANAKPVPGDDTINVHAEHTIMTFARELARPGEKVVVPLLVIAGDLQPDQQTGRSSPTLHPCGVCRDSFTEPGSPITDETLALTISPGFDTYQWFSIGALRAFHDHGDESGIHTVEFGERPLSLMPFTPELNSGPVSLAQFETPEYIESDRIISEKLTGPMAGYSTPKVMRATLGGQGQP